MTWATTRRTSRSWTEPRTSCTCSRRWRRGAERLATYAGLAEVAHVRRHPLHGRIKHPGGELLHHLTHVHDLVVRRRGKERGVQGAVLELDKLHRGRDGRRMPSAVQVPVDRDGA